jgi:hypothetical protein
MNRKGIVRIIEVTIAIILIAGVVLTLAASKKTVYEKDLSEILPSYLEEAAKDSVLREQIIVTRMSEEAEVRAAEGNLTKFIGIRITNPNYNFSIRVCLPTEVCPLNPYPLEARGNLYAAERIISATLMKEGETKKVKLYLWRIR